MTAENRSAIRNLTTSVPVRMAQAKRRRRIQGAFAIRPWMPAKAFS